MKICVVGAGAIGGMLAVKLANAGEEVSVIIRGANLAAVRANGMKLIMEDGSEHVAPQLMPAGLEVTVPDPPPALVTVRLVCGNTTSSIHTAFEPADTLPSVSYRHASVW